MVHPQRLLGFITLLTAAALVTACQAATPSGAPTAAGPGNGHPTSVAPSPTGTDASGTPAGWQRCTNTAQHFSLAYPPAWFTATPAAGRDCTLFDPAAFTVSTNPDDLTVLHVAMTVEYVPQTAAAFIADYDPAYHSFTIRQDTTVNGLHAVRYEMTTLIAGPPEPLNSKRYGYLIENGAQTLDIFTFAPPTETRYSAWQAVIDQAALSARFS